MATIKILSAENGEVLQNIDNNIVKLTQNSVIQVNADIDEVVTITRQGNSAVIQLKNGENIIIENYFDYPVDANRIVFENEGKLYWAEFTDQNGEMLDTILYHPLTEGTVESTNMAAGILPWLGGALAIGAIAAAAGSGGSSGGDSDSGSRDNTPPKLTDIIVNENGQLELSFNENVNGSNPRPEDFTVIVDGEEIPVTNIIVEGDKITLVTEPAIQDGQEVTVDYQDSTPNNDQGIKDSEGNVLDGLDSDAVGGVKNPDTTSPALLSAEVNENGNIELSFNEALDADNLPPATSLVVTVGTAPDQTTVNVIDIIADGNTLTLITDPVISAGQSINVVYTDPSAGNDLNAIQDTAGNDAAGFNTADLPNGVVNNSDQQDPDVDAPVLIDAEVNENGNIELSFNEDVSDSNPLNDDFTVTVDGTAVPVIDLLINGSIITLITDPEITQGQVVEVSYSDSTPGNAQGIQDSDGNVLEGFDAVDVGGVENNSDQLDPDVDAPVLIDAEVNENGNIELSFNEDVSTSNPLNADFTVTVDGAAVPVIDILINGSIITLITDPEITQGQVVEVSYSDSTSGNAQGIQDSDGNVLEGFDAVDVGGVENNSEQQTPDVDAPVLIDAEVNENGNIELSFNEDVSTSNPLNADFTVTVDGAAVPVIDILINGSIITLITDPEITQGQVVEVSYSDSTSGNAQGIQDSDGNVLEGFDAVDVGGVENNSEQQTPDVDAPVLIEAEVNENGNIELSFNEDVSTSNPLNADFTVTVDGAAVPVIDILINGSIITLITDPEITQGQVVEVSYSDSTSGNAQGIQDSDGNVLEGFDAVDVGGVENNSEQQTPDVDAPVLIDAEVNENGNIELSFNEDVSSSNPLNDDFTVTVDGAAVPVIDLLINGSIITLITDPEITQGQVVEVSYSDSTPGNAQGIQDSDGNVLEGFDAVDVGGVENNSDQLDPDVDAPVLIDAEVNENGNIELNFNEALDVDNLPPVASLVVTVGTAPNQTAVNVIGMRADGNTLTLITDPVISAGQSVNVVYTDPSAGNDLDAIQDTAGNDAAGFNTADLPNGVVNNSDQPTPDTVGPTLLAAEVNENGNIELSFNEALDTDNLPPAASLVVTVGTAPDQTVVNVTGISADGNTLTLITDPLISAGQSVNVVYTDPSAGNDLDAIQDTAGNDAAGFNTADLPNGVVNNMELPLSLANDEISALLVNKTINTATPLATIDEQDLISVLPGDSRIAVMNFTIDSGTEDVVIAVQQDNLVDLAGAFTFVVRNTTTGEEFQVAAADTSQGGLVAGALGLELLGGVADAQGLRLDISDLPAGNYEVSIYGDSSQLADILATVDLASLGDNTVNDLVSDTVLGLLETALTGPDADPRGLLEQLTLSQLLEVTTDIPALGTLTGAVNTILAPLLNNPLLGDLNNTSVGDIIAGNAGGALGFLLTTLGLGTVLNSLVNGVLAGVDGAGQALFDNLVEPLVSNILLDTVLEGTGLTTGLNSLLGSVNTLLDPLGLDNVLPTVDGLLDLVAQEILSNPLTLLGGTTAEVYEVNGETYRATGNIQEISVDGTQADNWGDGVLTAVKGMPVTFDSTDADGKFTLIQGTYGVLKLYDDGSFIYNSDNLNGQGTPISEVFSYTVTRNAGQAHEETASADLTINIDTVNQIINYADDPADNLLQGGAGNDILTGGAGADTAIYYLLNNTDATGGNDTDTWTDFNAAEGDTIDVSALLSNQTVNASNLGSYITLDQRGDDTIVMIDRDGSVTDASYTPTELIILQNTDSTSLVLDDLIKYNQI